MARAEAAQKQAHYYTIKEGTFRLPTTKEDPQAVVREYTNPKTKESGVAYERSYKALYGIIEDVSFRETSLKDGTVLRSININLGENEEDGVAMVVSMPQDSRFSSDFLKKLPNIDLTKEVRLMPYDFEPKQGPRQVGLAVHQQDAEGKFKQKVEDFFTEKIEDGDKTRYLNKHGYPEATDKDKKDWPFYFKKVNKFLIEYTEENILSKFQKDKTQKIGMEEGNDFEDFEAPAKDEINPDDIPFN